MVHLVQAVKQHLRLNQVEVLCRLVECSMTAIEHQKKIDLEGQSAELDLNDPSRAVSCEKPDILKEMLHLWKNQFQFVVDFMLGKVGRQIECIVDSEWEEELQVSNCSLKIGYNCEN